MVDNNHEIDIRRYGIYSILSIENLALLNADGRRCIVAFEIINLYLFILESVGLCERSDKLLLDLLETRNQMLEDRLR